ncbi:ABC transporter ATP-binding protein [Tuwongella immobilis]|uniref:ABC transporter domain-containing protein n=1 Tax=Tuwongella immobilis TaxID=692036 RepID=A0A6C2YTB9_9BACT|nr:ABC transporter ATP-binding protein [Tuwongella immobilis]VIP04960.1 sugar abc transporter : ABC-type polysaccharide/polyol phosphate transport system, ATPase component OS=Pelotomaculum thermopropionicum (strain DSM 13744 / JCM 10971 / SI) GN=TagH PE=4 SV=1: ABC_tran [Tuwongella immobilis]VTS07278.1 sugar abc transporter : ABC-type polysaccharide/polyol phosphate transport system, ATPase component OS=Pelotomaculum thermopropionicum (strain DSM 13744 / JCM 10971 / SI) GN=TagH PE=4 SV=1: ABC_tra
MATIELNDVSLTFRTRTSAKLTLKEYVVQHLFRRKTSQWMSVHALSHINLHAQDGDRIGIIGHNGAGKSTLLKLLAGIYPPTKGKRRVDGSICSLFDIALGFESEASGWENITYRGYLQGETPESLKPKIPGIAEFSGLGDFLKMPVRYYSAGMLIRLAFSIATAVEPEVLLIDEVLSVGDLAFQMKAQERMQELMKNARLMVMVSHDLKSLPVLCNRAIWMDQGHVRMDGDVKDVVKAYIASVNPETDLPAVHDGQGRIEREAA